MKYVSVVKYILRICCLSDNDPTIKCIDCGWKGEHVDDIGHNLTMSITDREKMESKKEIKMVQLKDTSAMSAVEKDAYAQELWEKLAGKKVKKEPK